MIQSRRHQSSRLHLFIFFLAVRILLFPFPCAAVPYVSVDPAVSLFLNGVLERCACSVHAVRFRFIFDHHGFSVRFPPAKG